MLDAQREEFRDRNLHFKAKGIKEAIARSERTRALLSALQVVSQSELLLQEFTQNYSLGRVLESLFSDMGVDLSKLQLTPQERAQQQAAQAARLAAEQGAGGASGGAPGAPTGGSST